MEPGPGVVHHDGREKCNAETQRGEEDVFPRRFGRSLRIVDRHEQRGNDGRDLDAYPEQRKPVDQWHDDQRPTEEIETSVEPSTVPAGIGSFSESEVALGEDARRHVQKCHREKKYLRERVHTKKTPCRHDLVRRARHQHQRQRERRRRHNDRQVLRQFDRRNPRDHRRYERKAH